MLRYRSTPREDGRGTDFASQNPSSLRAKRSNPVQQSKVSPKLIGWLKLFLYYNKAVDKTLIINFSFASGGRTKTIMNFQKLLQTFNLKTALKIAGMLILGLLILGLVASLGGFAFRTAFNLAPSSSKDSFSMQSGNYDMSGPEGVVVSKGYAPSATLQLSERNMLMPGFDDGYAIGADAEDFEITEYNANIKTSRLEKVCGELEALKIKDYVIFENTDKNDKYCGYRFKVEKDKSAEILQIIADLKPENLYTNTSSIQKQIADFTSEEEILTKRLEQIELTLTEAQNAYNTVTQLAMRTSDVETLAKVINDKIVLIEKLTTERLNTKNNLDRLSQAKAKQLDKLNYTFFSVSVTENLIVDFKAIQDSWERELKNFANEFNILLQGITLKLMSFAMKLIQIAIYLILALFLAKYGWRFIKFVWNK